MIGGGIDVTITPMDIHNKDFQRSFRGFNMDEVDDFLTSVQRELEKTLREKRELEDELEVVEGKLKNFEEMQEALNKSIVVAQDAADRLRENADHEVNVIRKEAENYSHEVRREADDYATQTKRDAEEKANQMLVEALEKAKGIEEETEQLRKHGRIFRQRLELLIESQLDLLKNEDWDNVLQETALTPPETQMIEEVEKELGLEDDGNDSAEPVKNHDVQPETLQNDAVVSEEDADEKREEDLDSDLSSPSESDYTVSIEFPEDE